MSKLSNLFSGWNGGQAIVKNGKFSTTKHNHNRNHNNCPIMLGKYSYHYLYIWFGGKDNFIKINKKCIGLYSMIEDSIAANLPSYMHPKYHTAFEQPKRRRDR